MKIKFIKPLPRIDHVIPAGYILDAPDGFAEKMIRTGRAVRYKPEKEVKPEAKPVEEPVEAKPVEAKPVETPVEEPVEEAPKPKTRARKKRDAE